MPLIKTALDAGKARQLAQAAGIVPEPGSAWKWALRNVRDGRGDLLQGKALGDAKLDLGKLPNNMRQKMESVIRRVGGDKEVGTIMKRNDPDWNESLSRGRVNRGELGEYNVQKRLEDTDALWKSPDAVEAFNDVMGKRLGPYRVGSSTNTTTASLADLQSGNVVRTIHNHPRNPFLSKMLQFNHERVFGNIEPDDMIGVGGGQITPHMLKRLKAINAENGRMASKGPSLVSPSGYQSRITPEYLNADIKNLKAKGATGLPDEATPQMVADSQPDGDYKAWLHKEKFNPGLTHNIIDHNFGHEGVHKLRPQGMRSVYFHRNGGQA